MTVEYKGSDPAEIVAEITHEATNALIPAELQSRINDVAGKFAKELQKLRAELILTIALFVEDTMTEHPGTDKDALLRMASNEAMFTHAFLARGLKKRLGEEIVPARQALIAFDVAEIIGAIKWEDSVGKQFFPEDGMSIRQMMADELAKRGGEA